MEKVEQRDKMEVLASASMDELEEMGLKTEKEIPDDSTPEKTDDKTAAEEKTGDKVENGEQDVDASAASGATDKAEEPEGDSVAMKSGKGTIPYAILKDTREELAKTKRELDQYKAATSKIELPEDHANQLEATQHDFEEAGAKFEDGDLTWDEYQAEVKEITKRRDDLLAVGLKAKLSQEINQEMSEQEAISSWQEAVDSFFSSKPDGIDYTGDQNLLDEFDAEVKALGQNDRYADKDYQWFLDTAHKILQVKLGQGENQTTAPAKEEKKEEKDVDPVKERPFHTLSDIPGGAPVAKNETEQLSSMSQSSLTNRFMNDPTQIDKVLSSLA